MTSFIGGVATAVGRGLYDVLERLGEMLDTSQAERAADAQQKLNAIYGGRQCGKTVMRDLFRERQDQLRDLKAEVEREPSRFSPGLRDPDDIDWQQEFAKAVQRPVKFGIDPGGPNGDRTGVGIIEHRDGQPVLICTLPDWAGKVKTTFSYPSDGTGALMIVCEHGMFRLVNDRLYRVSLAYVRL